jgi:chemotaxis signal transduction protein
LKKDEDALSWDELGRRLERYAGEIENAIAAVRVTRESEPPGGAQETRRPRLVATTRSERPSTAEVLRFIVGGEAYAIEPRFVVDVVEATPISVPTAPPHLAGAIVADGRLVPVFHLGATLHGAPTTDDGRHVLLLGSEGDAEIGVLSRGEPRWRRERDLTRPPWPLADRDAALILGVAADGLVVLRGDALLADDRLRASPLPTAAVR